MIKSQSITGKKILMIIAPDRFKDEELFEPKSIFESAGAQVVIASKNAPQARGMSGRKIAVDIPDIYKIELTQFNAVVFVGGPGAAAYFGDKGILNLAKAAEKQDKIIGAICIAPSILANAGILDGKKATCFPSEAQNLEKHGAAYTGDDVTTYGNIVTANGPAAARKFAEAIVELLSG